MAEGTTGIGGNHLRTSPQTAKAHACSVLDSVRKPLARFDRPFSILLATNRVNNPGRSQKIVISPCAQIQSSYHKQVRAPVDRIQEHKKLGWLFASPITDS